MTGMASHENGQPENFDEKFLVTSGEQGHGSD